MDASCVSVFARAERLRLHAAVQAIDDRHQLPRLHRQIDAVVVSIPDHMHATAAMWAMERNKHVYVQKPLVRTVWEGDSECREMAG